VWGLEELCSASGLCQEARHCLGMGKTLGKIKQGGKKVKIWKNSLVLTGDLCLVVGIWGPVGDSNMGAALPCKSKVAVLQPGKSAQSMQIPACILFVKHGNLVTINRGEQKTVCADGVPIITAGNKPHQNRSHNKIFPPPFEGCSALWFHAPSPYSETLQISKMDNKSLPPRIWQHRERGSIHRQTDVLYVLGAKWVTCLRGSEQMVLARGFLQSCFFLYP